MSECAPAYGLPRAPAVLTPSQLNRLAKGMLEDAFPLVWVEGELSNFSRAASGHWYFTLKDGSAQVRSAMFRAQNARVAMRPADGMKVLVRGRVTLYEARGDFQLVCEHMEEAGLGRLMQAFEALKAQLQAEGLTDPKRKRPLPAWPKRLAVITSPVGAAIRDVLTVCARRWPLMQIDIHPSAVQGPEAAAQLRAALAAAIAVEPPYDAILLTRGGGSLEDLWPFNDEALARAIAACPVPTVSAVGHEVDFTIADLVADVRAPTPSAAAELLTPDREVIATRLLRARRQLVEAQRAQLRSRQQRTDQAERLLRAHDPRRRLASCRQALALLAQRLRKATEDLLHARRSSLVALRARLREREPSRQIALQRQRAQASRLRLQHLSRVFTTRARTRLANLLERLRHTRLHLAARRQRLERAGHALHLLGPAQTLERGYVLVERGASLVTRAAAIRPGEALRLRFADGRIAVHVDEEDRSGATG
jgi:exodeoxyribonuclease VII large subunit